MHQTQFSSRSQSEAPTPISRTHPSKALSEANSYSWSFLSAKYSWVSMVCLSFALMAGLTAFFVWYCNYGNDPAPDSLVGLLYAGTGTLCLLLAFFFYSIVRRYGKRRIGKLNKLLHWHILLGCLALLLLFMHSFGNFNLRTGTYALCGLLALSVSGGVGRLLDALLARMITVESNKALTLTGDDKLKKITRQLQNFVTDEQQILVPLSSLYGRREQVMSGLPNDLLREHVVRHRIQAHVEEVQDIQIAMQREQLYRTIIRVWRYVHVLLAILTVALTLWHITYAMTLLLP